MAERNFLAEMTTKGDPMLKSQRYINDVRSRLGLHRQAALFQGLSNEETNDLLDLLMTK